MGVEVRVNGLPKSYGRRTLWTDVSFTLPAGEISTLVGPSGTGKSLLLKMLVGLADRTGAASSCAAGTSPGCPNGSSTACAADSAFSSPTAACSAR